MWILDLPASARNAETQRGQEVDCQHFLKIQVLNRIAGQTLLQTSQGLGFLLRAGGKGFQRMRSQRRDQRNLSQVQVCGIHLQVWRGKESDGNWSLSEGATQENSHCLSSSTGFSCGEILQEQRVRHRNDVPSREDVISDSGSYLVHDSSSPSAVVGQLPPDSARIYCGRYRKVYPWARRLQRSFQVSTDIFHQKRRQS